MFSGRARRSVNLGNKKQASTGDALRNAERQRQKREAQRRELQAVTFVQGRWRGVSSLRDARRALASEMLGDPQERITGEQFAAVLPVLPGLPHEQQLRLLSSFADSEASRTYISQLVDRLPIILSSNEVDIRVIAVRVLRHQNPPEINTKVVTAVLRHDDSEVIVWTAQRDGKHFLEALLSLPASEHVIERLPVDALRPLYSISALPGAEVADQDNLWSLAVKVAAESTGSWPLLLAIVSALQNAPKDKNLLITDLCSQQIVRSALTHSPPMLAAKYFQSLLDLFPEARSDILLQLSIATSPSPLTTFWTAYKETHSEFLLYMVVELYSYWLLVATDSEIVNNMTHGLSLEDLRELATVVRDSCFAFLWFTTPNKRVVVGNLEASLLKLLRQLYTRDSRIRLFPARFWLMESKMMLPQNQFVQVVDETAFQEDFVDDDEDDDYGDDVGPRKTTLTLRPSPPMRVLEYAPFFVAFETRVALFYKFIAKDRESRPLSTYVREHYDINRETLMEDAEKVFKHLGPRLKTELMVRLVSNGIAEPGIDGGGLTREVLMAICTEAFKEEPVDRPRPLFIETVNHTLSPNPLFGELPQYMTPEVQGHFFFLGQTIGKCLYENLLVDVEFAPCFLSKWSQASTANSIRSAFDDLSLLDAELYRNMAKLHNIHGSDVAALGLDFTIVNSQGQTVELRPGGAQIAVTDANKLEYMRELANYKLNTALKPQTVWFLLGMSQVIRLKWLNMFNPAEINKLISGENQDIDVDDLRLNTEIFGFEMHSETVENFWRLLRELTPEQRSKFLKFVTSVPKGPLLGFSKLEPHFGIRSAGQDDQRLPTASTCVNLLKLPEYSSFDVLKEKLLYSIESGAGFELS